MNLSDLQKQGFVKPFKASPTQIRERLNLAKRDIATAKKLLGSDSDWAFSIAYNAVLQAARALMFAKGYRPSSGEGQHVAAVRFAEVILGKELGDEKYF
ncbi:MAG: HEPN domain-containing protein [Deltaproteobacteria bacterium]|nr:HEPN domain-containing protein [Deltaproteobacteria bacterium]